MQLYQCRIFIYGEQMAKSISAKEKYRVKHTRYITKILVQAIINDGNPPSIASTGARKTTTKSMQTKRRKMRNRNSEYKTSKTIKKIENKIRKMIID